MSMIQLVYVSSAVRFMNDEELTELLRISRENNARLDITGLLLYKDGNFIQALEGPEEVVLPLYDKICRDRRHTGVMTLVKEPIKTRLFPEWSMGFQNVNQMEAAELPGFNAFLTESFTPENFRQNPSRVTVLLTTFKKMMR